MTQVTVGRREHRRAELHLFVEDRCTPEPLLLDHKWLFSRESGGILAHTKPNRVFCHRDARFSGCSHKQCSTLNGSCRSRLG